MLPKTFWMSKTLNILSHCSWVILTFENGPLYLCQSSCCLNDFNMKVTRQHIRLFKPQSSTDADQSSKSARGNTAKARRASETSLSPKANDTSADHTDSARYQSATDCGRDLARQRNQTFAVNNFEHRHRAQQRILEQQQPQLRGQKRIIDDMQPLQRQQMLQQRLGVLHNIQASTASGQSHRDRRPLASVQKDSASSDVVHEATANDQPNSSAVSGNDTRFSNILKRFTCCYFFICVKCAF